MNYYEILGVKKYASIKEVKASYKKLVKKYHPDIYPGDKTFAEKKMKEFNTAYDVLSDSQKKEDYDAELKATDMKFNTSIPNYSQNYYTSNRYAEDRYNYYKQKYYNNPNYRTNSSSSYRNDGSEHDYSTYVNYEKRYESYYRNKTGNPGHNPSYAEQLHDDISNKIVNNFNKMSRLNQIRIFILILGIYIVILLVFMMQFRNVFNNQTSSNFSNNNSYTNQIPYNSTSPNHSDFNDSQPNINLDDYITPEEVQELYDKYGKNSGYFNNIEDFKDFLELYILQYYY